MSEPAEPSRSRTDRSGTVPRALVHKQILDAARADPGASFEGIAEGVSGASIDLVEKVLEEYGDPVAQGREEEQTDGDVSDAAGPRCTGETPADDGTSHAGPETRPAGLTGKQRETLRAIARHPEATQAELGEILGVTGATICSRLSSIDGFDWEARCSFVATALDDEELSGSAGETAPAIDDLAARVEAIEERLDEREGRAAAPFCDSELTHKVLHACLQSDLISEDEELRLLRELLSDDSCPE